MLSTSIETFQSPLIISYTQHHVALKTLIGGLKVSQSSQKQPENQ
jgi:hypothetical protein